MLHLECNVDVYKMECNMMLKYHIIPYISQPYII
jgi:hypothetical protein